MQREDGLKRGQQLLCLSDLRRLRELTLSRRNGGPVGGLRASPPAPAHALVQGDGADPGRYAGATATDVQPSGAGPNAGPDAPARQADADSGRDLEREQAHRDALHRAVIDRVDVVRSGRSSLTTGGCHRRAGVATSISGTCRDTCPNRCQVAVGTAGASPLRLRRDDRGRGVRLRREATSELLAPATAGCRRWPWGRRRNTDPRLMPYLLMATLMVQPCGSITAGTESCASTSRWVRDLGRIATALNAHGHARRPGSPGPRRRD
jgi:hypothetical protein